MRKTKKELNLERTKKENKLVEKIIDFQIENNLSPQISLLIICTGFNLKKANSILNLNTKNNFSRALLFEQSKENRKEIENLKNRNKLILKSKTGKRKYDTLYNICSEIENINISNFVLEHVISNVVGLKNIWLEKPQKLEGYI